MGLFKPKGKHAQKAYVELESVSEEESAEAITAPEAANVDEATDAAGEPAQEDNALEPASEEAEAEEEPAEVENDSVDEGEVEDDTEVASDEDADDAIASDDDLGKYKDPETGAYIPVTSEGVVLKKKTRPGKVIGITFGAIIGVLLIAYIAGAIVFMGRFFPNTSIAGQDVSMMPNEEVAQLLDKMVDDYELDIVGNEFNFHADAASVGMDIDSESVVNKMHADLSPWAWPVLLAQDSHDETSALAVSYDTKKYDYKIVDAVREYNKDAVAPIDATIAYDEKQKKFTIVDEIPGTQYDSHVILAKMNESIASLNPKIKLTSDYLIQPNVFSTDERLKNSAEMATGLVSAHVKLTMDGVDVSEIDGSNLSQFIRMNDDLGVTLDDEALDQWVTDLSNGFDTVGTERTYTRPDGKEISISGGAYGWITDAPALKDEVVAAIKSGESTTIDIPCEQTAAVYNGPGQPDWGSRYIDVDLSEQYVRFYDGDSVIWESACISGSPDGQHNTWPGVWYITNKESPSKLIGYLPNGQKEYETTVSYWMAFEGNGIGLHDATWQPSFGGSMYANGYGSHGCVNLPYDAAASLYDICDWGDVVIAHY